MQKMALADYEKLVGTEIGVSEWITVSQDMIDGFSNVTGDRQFIHNNPERAANETPFGGAIAHGFLTLSLITQMYKDTTPIIVGHDIVINYGLNRIRFLAPVPSGARIRGRITLAKVAPRGDTQILTENKVVVEIEDAEKPAMLGTWVTLLIKDTI
jgi:acyl dehydratase